MPKVISIQKEIAFVEKTEKRQPKQVILFMLNSIE